MAMAVCLSTLDQLDARHLGAVTLAVTGLENARVSTGARCEPRAQLLEQLVGRGTLLNVAGGEAARVERPRLRLGDQLLDEWPELLGLRLGRHDRARFDERDREVAHERELLLAGAAKLASRLPVTHTTYSSSSSGAFAAARLGGVPQSVI